jgi:hypothetical protein
LNPATFTNTVFPTSCGYATPFKNHFTFLVFKNYRTGRFPQINVKSWYVHIYFKNTLLKHGVNKPAAGITLTQSLLPQLSPKKV